MFIVFLVVALVLVTVLYLMIQRAGGLTFPWIQFYVRGKESGFKFGEINLLRQVAVKNKLKNPTSLFWSVRALDRCIRATIISLRSSGKDHAPGALAFLNKLFDFRRRVEFDQPKYKLGLSSTRGISPGQTLKITLPGSGVYVSKVIENNRRYMAVTYPKGNPLPPGFSWRNQAMKVYFWRKEDAGYYFESKVIGDYLDRKVPILHINHADDLVRAQKRKSVRREYKAKGTVFPLKSLQEANEDLQSSGGYRGQMLDLSEDGFAVAIGGQAKAGLPIKIQTTVNGEPLVMCGAIKSVNYKERNRVSVLHVEAVPPSNEMRVRILSFVYGLFEGDNGTPKPTDGKPEEKSAESSGSADADEEPATPRQRAAANAEKEREGGR